MQALYDEQRIPLVLAVLAEQPYCQLGPKLQTAKPDYAGCWGRSTCLHELKKRSAGGSITDRSNVLASCLYCNGYVEDHPLIARRAGLVIRNTLTGE